MLMSAAHTTADVLAALASKSPVSPAWHEYEKHAAAVPVPRPVPEDKLLLDGYPVASRSPADADRAAGFTSQRALRLLTAVAVAGDTDATCISTG